MKEKYFQPSKKINVNITVKDLRNNSRGLTYCKAFTPQTIGKYCLLLPVTKNEFISYFLDLKNERKRKW